MDSAAKMEGDPGFRSFAERCEPPEPSAATTALEVKTEREKVIGLASGGQEDAVRVSYRQPPTRQWTRFLLIPDEGQPLEELEEYAHDAAVVHATLDWRTP